MEQIDNKVDTKQAEKQDLFEELDVNELEDRLELCDRCCCRSSISP